MIHNPRRQAYAAALLFTALGLAGCSTDGPIGGFAKATGFATETPGAADFVEASRSANEEYRPIGRTPPARDLAPLKDDELDALKANLEKRRANNDQAAAAARALGSTPMAQPPVVAPLE
ncbi:hypothetical protein [Pseudochelatococcus contaminans]|uniref:DUF3035 domain-containing protein n=1 Tax=Pseudochelatococcus contaminans TaxID=1538103 RepID=A0A7W5Z4K3_9HYPH|nr:hypothetical protein [Pseudochelatococcus contaminans]MBB3809879.1 hypothetical protein [Pseudochelatococcus contaminans]